MCTLYRLIYNTQENNITLKLYAWNVQIVVGYFFLQFYFISIQSGFECFFWSHDNFSLCCTISCICDGFANALDVLRSLFSFSPASSYNTIIWAILRKTAVQCTRIRLRRCEHLRFIFAFYFDFFIFFSIDFF